MRILHVATELFPLLKVGGLADVLAALPMEQMRQGHSVRVLLPGLRPVLEGLQEPEPQPWGGPGRLLLGLAPSGLPLYVLDRPDLFGHGADPNDPYADGGSPRRWRTLAEAALRLAGLGDGRQWRPDVVHGHDWPAGLAIALLAGLEDRPSTVFTIHNAAYQGLFPAGTFPQLGLPSEALRARLDFHGQLSLLKAGLLSADRLTTVSPTYAEELTREPGGRGLEPLFRQRAGDLTGILNGVDLAVWNPATDPALPVSYDADHLALRAVCKRRLQAELGLHPDPAAPLFGIVSRLDPLKGLDLVLEDLPVLDALGAQLALLGRGDEGLETAFTRAAAARPGRLAAVRGQQEGLARRIFAGADFLLVPSRYEPCGLTQLYGLRYGAIPVVHRTGGLADTVVDASDPERGIGLVFDAPSAGSLAVALDRAARLLREDRETVRILQLRGMEADLGWSRPARAHAEVYRSIRPALAAHG